MVPRVQLAKSRREVEDLRMSSKALLLRQQVWENDKDLQGQLHEEGAHLVGENRFRIEAQDILESTTAKATFNQSQYIENRKSHGGVLTLLRIRECNQKPRYWNTPPRRLEARVT